jgi:nitrous oxidase accessory protein
MDVPAAQFFKGSPMLEALDFLERLAPFSQPDLILRDEKPLLVAAAAPQAGSAATPWRAGEPATQGQPLGEPSPPTSESPSPESAYEQLKRSLGQP